ncbi:MAG: peptidyl-prolyl cis-trans isomerase [Acidobacteria bacterium]|nr:peptidyl-prolyl cis-trans isomerase [Acidobacteriota bacterium]MYJ06294.1 peptidyl-prolyl cis-trans isomerase [Acidobacteriota bacterium]
MRVIRGTSPLLVFLFLGTAVFLFGRWQDQAEAEGRVVSVSEDQIAAIRQRWVAQWGREPTPRELRGLIDDAVREEILYREARRLALDRNDPIVRRRLAQKLTFMLEDNADVPAPAAEDVETHFAVHADRYRVPRRTTFRHVFLGDDGRTDPAADAVDLLDEARRGRDGAWRDLGDPFILLREYADRSDQEIAELFGGRFAAALSDVAVGRWHGPVRSAHGTHLVLVMGRTEPRTPDFDDVRLRVADDLLAIRRRAQNQAAIQAVRERYEVRLPVAGDSDPGGG